MNQYTTIFAQDITLGIKLEDDDYTSIDLKSNAMYEVTIGLKFKGLDNEELIFETIQGDEIFIPLKALITISEYEI